MTSYIIERIQDTYITAISASKTVGISPNCVYQAIKHGKIKSYKILDALCVRKDEFFDAYRLDGRNKKFIFSGEKIFKSPDNLSVAEVAKKANVKIQYIYNLIRRGKIDHKKVCGFFVMSHKSIADAIEQDKIRQEKNKKNKK